MNVNPTFLLAIFCSCNEQITLLSFIVSDYDIYTQISNRALKAHEECTTDHKKVQPDLFKGKFSVSQSQVLSGIANFVVHQTQSVF